MTHENNLCFSVCLCVEELKAPWSQSSPSCSRRRSAWGWWRWRELKWRRPPQPEMKAMTVHSMERHLQDTDRISADVRLRLLLVNIRAIRFYECACQVKENIMEECKWNSQFHFHFISKLSHMNSLLSLETHPCLIKWLPLGLQNKILWNITVH